MQYHAGLKWRLFLLRFVHKRQQICQNNTFGETQRLVLAVPAGVDDGVAYIEQQRTPCPAFLLID